MRLLLVILVLGLVVFTNRASAAPSFFIQGGNTFGTNAELGTNDNFSLYLKTNNITQFEIDPNGTALFSNDIKLVMPNATLNFLNGAGEDQTKAQISYENSEQGLILSAPQSGIHYPQLIVKTGGGVGIGTAWPQSTLQVYDQFNSTLRVGGLEAPDSPPYQQATGCLIMGDSDHEGITYITVNDGVLSASATKPAICD
jgi:hypothetical protein